MLNEKRERPELKLDRVDVLKLQLREVKGLEGNYEHEVPSRALQAAGNPA